MQVTRKMSIMTKYTGIVAQKVVGLTGYKKKSYILNTGRNYYTLRYAGRHPYEQGKNLPALLGCMVEFTGKVYGRFLFVKSWDDYKVVTKDSSFKEFNLGF